MFPTIELFKDLNVIFSFLTPDLVIRNKTSASAFYCPLGISVGSSKSISEYKELISCKVDILLSTAMLVCLLVIFFCGDCMNYVVF